MNTFASYSDFASHAHNMSMFPTFQGRRKPMGAAIIIATILGLTLVFLPLVVGALYLRERQSEKQRLERRFRDLE